MGELIGLLFLAWLVSFIIRSAIKGSRDESKESIDKLVSLSTLKERGVITAEEFETQKNKLLKK